jgi:hypothetical protein
MFTVTEPLPFDSPQLDTLAISISCPRRRHYLSGLLISVEARRSGGGKVIGGYVAPFDAGRASLLYGGLLCARAASGGAFASPRLQSDDAVETTGRIRPPGVAEIHRAAAEYVGLERQPGGIDQSGRGFNDDGHAAGPGDIEPELIRTHAEARAECLHLRQPGHSGTTGKRRAPARRVREIMDRRLGVTAKHRAIRRRRVAEEISIRQVGTRTERITGDVADAVGNRDAGQAGIPGKRIVADADHRQVNYRVGDTHVTPGAAVTRNGDRVVIGCVRVILGRQIHGQARQQRHSQCDQLRRDDSSQSPLCVGLLVRGRAVGKSFTFPDGHRQRMGVRIVQVKE